MPEPACAYLDRRHTGLAQRKGPPPRLIALFSDQPNRVQLEFLAVPLSLLHRFLQLSNLLLTGVSGETRPGQDARYARGMQIGHAAESQIR